MIQGPGYYQRDKTRWRTLYWTVREIIQWTLAIIPWHSLLQAIAKEKILFSHVCFLFVQFFAREQISVLNIVPPPSPVLKFRDLVRKWHHNSDDSTDIIFRLILSVLYFSLISSCVIHHLLWHLFFAAQFQGQIICFHYKVWICWCTSVFFSKHLIELSPMLRITVRQIVKTRVWVNLKHNNIIIIFYLVH